MATDAHRGGVAVISDIDDTIHSSGGLTLAGYVNLGGVDTQYARGTIYPGVCHFFLALVRRPRPARGGASPRGLRARGLAPPSAASPSGGGGGGAQASARTARLRASVA